MMRLYEYEMMKTVIAVANPMKIARYVCWPRALKASSGPYEDDERPSDPRPIHARRGMRDNLWNIDGSLTSRGVPMIFLFNFLINDCSFSESVDSTISPRLLSIMLSVALVYL